ncbi:MAG: PAS domain S-box protein, partial [Candidatus Aegiribacteria sp.]|nr:PAS domain S-box protein [Candidatus Aegiribacteria sp.]
MKPLLSEVSDAVVLADSQGKVSFMNPRAEKLTGLKAGQAAGMDLWEACAFADGTTGKNLRNRMEEALKHDGYFIFPPTTVLIRREGDNRPVTGGVFMSDEKGTGTDSIEGLVFRDVSREWIVNPYVRKQQNADTLMVLAGCIRNNLNDLLTVLLSNL